MANTKEEQKMLLDSLSDMFQDIDVATIKDVLVRRKYNEYESTDELLSISAAQSKNREEEEQRKRREREENELRIIQKQIEQQQLLEQQQRERLSEQQLAFDTSSSVAHNSGGNNSNIYNAPHTSNSGIFNPQPQVPTAPPSNAVNYSHNNNNNNNGKIYDDPVAQHYASYTSPTSGTAPSTNNTTKPPLPATQFDNYYQRIVQQQQQNNNHQQQLHQQPQQPFANYTSPQHNHYHGLSQQQQQQQSSPFSTESFTVVPQVLQQQQQPSPYHRPLISTLSPTISKSPAGYIHNFPPLTPISSQPPQPTPSSTQSPLTEDEFTTLSSASGSFSRAFDPTSNSAVSSSPPSSFYTPLDKPNSTLRSSASNLSTHPQQQQQHQAPTSPRDTNLENQQALEIERLKKELDLCKGSQESLIQEIGEMRKELLSIIKEKETVEQKYEQSKDQISQLGDKCDQLNDKCNRFEMDCIQSQDEALIYKKKLEREKLKNTELQKMLFSALDKITKEFKDYIQSQDEMDEEYDFVDTKTHDTDSD